MGNREGHRFVIERFDAGGVALHLDTGACFRLNEVAAAIGTELLSGRSVEALARDLSARFDISLEQALADVVNTRTALEKSALREECEEALRYDATQAPHLVLVNDKPVLRIHPARAALELVDPAPSAKEVRDAVDGVLPKLLALRGFVTMHASAVHEKGEVRAFSGASFAGKTTTARAFAAAGESLVSEDVLVVRLGQEAPSVLVEAEAGARAFAERMKRAFEEDPRAVVDFSPLDELAGTEALPLGSIWFLEEARREGADIRLQRLDHPDALILLLRNLFLASMEPSDWRASFEKMAQVSRQLPAFAATMPSGLDALRAAVSGVVRGGDSALGR